MKPSHTYEISALAKSLKKSLDLGQSHAQILEALAKAAGHPSYGHFTAAKTRDAALPSPHEVTSEMLEGTTQVYAEMYTDDHEISFELDGRLFLLTERPEVVLNAVFCQLFSGGFDSPTDCIAEAGCYSEKFEVIHSYTSMARSQNEGIGFEASIDAEQALSFLALKRPEILYGYEEQLPSEPEFKAFVTEFCQDQGVSLEGNLFERHGPSFCAALLSLLAAKVKEY